MKYVVDKVSTWGVPCEGAIKENIVEVFHAGCRSMEEALRIFHPPRFTNLRKADDGSLVCDCHEDRWTVEVEDLNEFVKKNGRIIVEQFEGVDIKFKIIIYDDYIE